MSQGHILIVEDEIAVREAICATLASYRVGVATTIKEAQAYLQAHQIDLVLLDLRLGAENGMDIAHHVRRQSPYVAIVILTGHGNLKSAIHAIELDAQAYLLKPISPDKLEAVVDEQISRMHDIRQRDTLAGHMRSAVEMMQTQNTHTTEDHLVSGKLVMNRDRHEARYDGDKVTLSTTQFRLLWTLVDAEGETIAPQVLASEAMGYDVRGKEASDLVRGHISKIRRQIALHAGEYEHIRTIRNEGYIWVT